MAAIAQARAFVAPSKLATGRSRTSVRVQVCSRASKPNQRGRGYRASPSAAALHLTTSGGLHQLCCTLQRRALGCSVSPGALGKIWQPQACGNPGRPCEGRRRAGGGAAGCAPVPAALPVSAVNLVPPSTQLAFIHVF